MVFDGMHHPFGLDQLQLYRKMSFERDLLPRFIRWFICDVLEKGGTLFNIEHVGIDISCNMILALYYFDSLFLFMYSGIFIRRK